MTPLAALALAIRDRLVAGAPAPLPGLGTLGRAHVSARVHTGSDGRRVLLPPGEAVGLSARAYDPADLAAAFARRAGAPEAEAASLLRKAVDQIEARLAITGDMRLEGVGVFQRTSDGIRFAPAPELLTAVNRPFEGLRPVEIGDPTAPELATPRPAEPETLRPTAPPPAAEPDAIDILLDLIVNEPAEPETAEPETAETETAEPETSRSAHDEHPAHVSPAESTFLDDLSPVAATFAAPFGTPEATAETHDDAALGEAAEDEVAPDAGPLGSAADAFAVPSDAGASPSASLTETDWHPAPMPGGDSLGQLSPEFEDAEVLDRPVAALPALPVDPPPVSDTHALLEPTDAWVDAPPEEALQHAEPAPPSDGSLWSAVYVLLVVALSSLVVWWAVAEQHPRIVRGSPAAATPPLAAPAAVPATAPLMPADTLSR